MRCVAGAIYRPGGGLEEGWLLVDGGRVVDAGEGKPPQKPEATGLVLPATVNAHTHVGDRVGRGAIPPGMSLADVVRPPHGLKHRLLADTPRARLVEGMRAGMEEMRAAGSRACLDFREQGLDGVRMLREGAVPGVDAIALARPREGWDDAEADAVAREADGIGLSLLGDVADDVPKRAARAARRHRKRFALHFSEDRREDVARALELRPDFLVHACETTSDDLQAIAAARVPIVLCPRSNARFGREPPARAMLDAGVPLALGSDNAMFHGMDVLEDARWLAGRHPDVPRETWLDAAIAGGAALVDGAPRASWLRKGDAARLLVVDAKSVGDLFTRPHPPMLVL